MFWPSSIRIFACKVLALTLGSPLQPALLGAPSDNPPEATWFARKWQSEEGLPENSITGVTQTKDGYIWVSTRHALARFDGVRFETLSLPVAPSPLEPSLHALLAAREGGLWLAMESGVVMSLSATRTNVFTTASGLPMGRPVASDQDSTGAVWIAYADGSVCRILQNRVKRFEARHGLSGAGPCWISADAEGRLWFAKAGRVGVFRNNRFVPILSFGRSQLKLCAAREGGLWICAGLELWRYLPEQAPVKVATINPARASASTRVMIEDRIGAVWIGTASGLFRYAPSGGVTTVATSHPDITDLAEDREGNIWAGTYGGGLNRLRPGVVTIESSITSLPFSTVRSMCRDSAGDTWAVSQTGVVWQKSDAGWQINVGQGAWQNGRATCVSPAGEGGIWVATQDAAIHLLRNEKVFSLTREQGLEGISVRALLLSAKGDLWIGQEEINCVQRLRDGVLTTYPLPVNNRPVRAMAEDASGDIWMGTAAGHLFRARGETLHDETPAVPVRRPIRCLYATADGSVWIGFAGMGVGRVKNGRFSQAGTSKGLHDDFVSQIAADNHGSLWIGADRGIFEVRQRELEEVMDGRLDRVRSLLYGKDEGLPSLQADYGYCPTVLREPSGVLWFPMRTGLARVRPESVRTSHVPPPVVIETVLLDGVVLHPQSGSNYNADPVEQVFSVRPNHRKIEVRFTALSFVAPDNVHFKHRLEGLDEAWSEPATGRTVSFPRLPHGNYRFVLTACNRAGAWNPIGAALRLKVHPFFWQTWWFRSSVVLSSILLIGGLVRFVSFRALRRRLSHLERETAVQHERARIAKDIHDDLGASLTQIALLGELARADQSQPEKLETHITNIASTARSGVKSLEEIVWAVNPRNDTLAHLLGYVGQYAVDFLEPAQVRCRIDFPEQLPEVTVSADVRHNLFLTAKEALNNVVKHAHATEVWLRASVSDHRLSLAIEDNGRGFNREREASSGNGLGNLQQRLTEIGGVCKTESAIGQGTRVCIVVGLKH